MAFGINLIVLFAIWIWRLLVSLFATTFAFFRNLIMPNIAILLSIAVILFGAGIVVQEFQVLLFRFAFFNLFLQDEIMSIIDIIYECGIFPASQVVLSWIVFFVKIPYEFLAEMWNDTVVFLIETVEEIINDLAMAIKIGQIDGISEIYRSVVERSSGFFPSLIEDISLFFNLVSDGFSTIGDLIACWWSTFFTWGSAIVSTKTVINQDCTWCAMDPPVNPADQPAGTVLMCSLREPFPQLGSPDPDCFECLDFLEDFFVCIANFGEFVTFGLFDPGDLQNFGRLLACVINSAIKPPSFIFTGILDFFITGNCVDPFGSEFTDAIDQWFLSTDCGKPVPAVNCILISDGGTDIPIGVIPCWDELISWVTDGEITNFFELIFSFLFSFIDIVISSIENIVLCFNAPGFAPCLDNFPTNAPEGAPGVCQYSGDIVVPVNGIQDCFEILGSCLDNPVDIPLLIPLVDSGILDFLTSTFWAISVDLATCPFALLQFCFDPVPPCAEGFPPPIFNDVICSLVCIEDTIPILAPFASVFLSFILLLSPILNFIFDVGQTTVINAVNVAICLNHCTTIEEFISIEASIEIDPPDIEISVSSEALDCMATSGAEGCNTKRRRGDPDYVPMSLSNVTEIHRDKWRTLLLEHGIRSHTTCGNILHSKIPPEVTVEEGWGDYSMYWGCFKLLSVAYPWRQKCSMTSHHVEFDRIMSLSTIGDTLGELVECAREYSTMVPEPPPNTSIIYHDITGEPVYVYEYQRRNAEQGTKLAKGFLNMGKTVGSAMSAIWKKGEEGAEGTAHGILRKYKDSVYHSIYQEFSEEWKGIKDRYSDIYANFTQSIPVPSFHDGSAMMIADRAIGPHGPIIPEEIRLMELKELRHAFLAYANTFRLHYELQSKPGSRTYYLHKRNITTTTSEGRRDTEVSLSSSTLTPRSIAEYRMGFLEPTLVKSSHSSSVVEVRRRTDEDWGTLTADGLTKKLEKFQSVVDWGKEKYEKVEEKSDTLWKVWEIVADRYDVNDWPWVRKIAGARHLLRQERGGSQVQFWRWMSGEEEYLPSKGDFVDKKTFDYEIEKKDLEKRGSVLDIATNVRQDYRLSGENRRYSPFPFFGRPSSEPLFNDTNGNMSAMVREFVVKKHATNEDRKRLHRELGIPKTPRNFTKGTQNTGIFTPDLNNVNDVLYELANFFLELLTGVANVVTDWLESIVKNFLDSNPDEFIFDTLVDFFVDFVSCDIPENFNGTDVYSPFCFFLAPEDKFRLLVLSPNDLFTVQIEWPEDLIASDCVNVYNGDNFLPDFELSNNCMGPDDPDRPFCPTCDYCERTYRACLDSFCTIGNTTVDLSTLCGLLGGTPLPGGDCLLSDGTTVLNLAEQCETLGGTFDRGFGDVLDSILYILAVIPTLFEGLIQGGIPIKDIEGLWGLFIVGIFAPVFYNPATLFIWPIFVLFIGLTTFPIWIVFNLFGAEFPIILAIYIAFLVLAVLALIYLPQLATLFIAIFTILNLLLVIWVLGLVFDFPDISDTFDIIQLLSDALVWLNKFPLLWWIELQPWIDRVNEFDFGSGPIPPLETFCFFWNFSNFGFLILLGYSSIFVGRLLLSWIIATFIFITQLILLIFWLVLRFRIWLTERDVDNLEEDADERDDRLDQLEDSFNTFTESTASGRVGEAYRYVSRRFDDMTTGSTNGRGGERPTDDQMERGDHNDGDDRRRSNKKDWGLLLTNAVIGVMPNFIARKTTSSSSSANDPNPNPNSNENESHMSDGEEDNHMD